MVNSIIEGLQDYLSDCPLFADFNIGANWKEDEPDSAGIIEDNTDTLDTYLSGTQLKQLHASIYLGALSDADFLRLKNSSFMEQIRRWFKQQSAKESFPEMPDGYTPQEISADEGIPFEYESDGRKCTYQIRITLEYTEEAINL